MGGAGRGMARGTWQFASNEQISSSPVRLRVLLSGRGGGGGYILQGSQC